jgi:hypothetical protein
MTFADDRSISAAQRQCAAACRDCRDACLAAIAYCLQTRGDAEDAAHIRQLRECAEHCDRASSLLRTEANNTGVMAAVAEVAGRCTRVLIDQFPDDTHLQACADACHVCAIGCRDATTPSVPYDEAVEESFPASDPPAR